MFTPPMRGLATAPPPEASVLLLIDHQPLQYLYSHDPKAVSETVLELARAARSLGVPTVLTNLAEEHNGPLLQPLQNVFGDRRPIDRPSVDGWDDRRVTDAVLASGRKNLVIAGLHTETSVCRTALRAVGEGLDVHVVTDACGGVTAESHDGIVRHLARAGVIPVTWDQVGAAWLGERAQGAIPAAADSAVPRSDAAPSTSFAWARPLRTAPAVRL
ncbi:isochorismatase family protein [Streptomyces fuscichromogenes]|uniref:isochorismatase family protein n=1 Tax=Streptomyces fuscichromogenes TaxID=1324013 RepID=UPI00382EE08C